MIGISGRADPVESYRQVLHLSNVRIEKACSLFEHCEPIRCLIFLPYTSIYTEQSLGEVRQEWSWIE